MLTKEPDRLYAIVKAVKDAAGVVPVTVKIRSGWDAQHLTWKEAAEAALSAGVDGITIHARTRAQGYEGKADWEIQRKLVEYVNGKIPVFGSGDAHTPETAKKMLEETGVDGVMFARGAMGDPFLFTRTKQYLLEGSYQEESVKERLLAGFRELDMNIDDKGEKQACLQMRKKFCAYSSGIRGGAKLRLKVVNACTKEDYQSIKMICCRLILQNL